MGVMSLVEDAEVSTGAASIDSHLANNMLSAARTYHPSHVINSNFTLPPHSAAVPYRCWCVALQSPFRNKYSIKYLMYPIIRQFVHVLQF